MVQFGDTAEAAFRYVGWTFIPNNLTHFLIVVISRVRRQPPPPKGSPQYQQMYRSMYALVVGGYLAYMLFQAAHSQPPNYYELLGVPTDAEEGQMKVAFRTFARRNHPDKVGDAGADVFMRVRDAYEGLMNPTKRFAYDRFGQPALEFENCITEDEYMHTGLMQCTAFYVVTILIMVIYGVLGDPDSGAIWRYLFFFYLMACEALLYVQPFPSASPGADTPFPVKTGMFAFPSIVVVLRQIFPNWVPFQYASFLRQLYVAVSIAITRVMPMFFPGDNRSAQNNAALESLIKTMEQLVVAADREVNRMWHSQILQLRGEAPFPKEQTINTIRHEVETAVADSLVQANPMLGSLWKDSIRKHREQAGDVSFAAAQEEGTLTGSDHGSRAASPCSPTETFSRLPSVSPTLSPRPPLVRERSKSLPPLSAVPRFAISPSTIQPFRLGSPAP